MWQLLQKKLKMCNFNRTKILRAGVAKSDITTSTPETPVMDPLYAKALVLDDSNIKLVVVTMDVTSSSHN